MSKGRVALCVDEESIRRPELIGLDDENLSAQEWLDLYTDAEDARRSLKEKSEVSEVWVVSCQQMEPVNLAAALKSDEPSRPVVLVSEDAGGSLRSCAAKALIDEVIDTAALMKKYAFAKSAWSIRSASNLIDAFSPTTPSVTAIRGSKEIDKVDEASFALETLASSMQKKDCSGLDRMPSASRAFLLPVLSGSGGAGKSTISVVAAMLLQRAGLQTLLIDLDLQFGDIGPMLGMKDQIAVDDILRSPVRASQLVPKGGLPAFLRAPSRIEDAELLIERVSEVLGIVEGRFDVIVVNTGAFWTELHAQVLERSSKALFLVDQRPSSLRACRRALDLCARCGIAASPFVFAPNRCSKNALYTSIDVSCALQGAEAFEIAEGGSEVEELLAEGQPLELVTSGNALVQSADRLLRSIVPVYAEAMNRRGESIPARSFWERIGLGRRKHDREVRTDVSDRESA